MSVNEARKLKVGDKVRLKSDGSEATVTGREDSGRVIYLERHGQRVTLKNDEIRLPARGA